VDWSWSMTRGDVTEHFCSAGMTPATSADSDEDSARLTLTFDDEPIVIVPSLADDSDSMPPQRKYRGCITNTSGLSQVEDQWWVAG